MPRLFHDRDYDVFNPQLHILVGPGEKVDISAEDEGRVNTVTGIWHVENDKKAPAQQEDRASRRTGKRGASVVEQSGPPPMETR